MTGQELAKAFADFVNGAGSEEKKEFVETLLKQHRTLQQESFDLMIETMEAWAKLPEVMYDPRNKFAVEMSKQIIEKNFK